MARGFGFVVAMVCAVAFVGCPREARSRPVPAEMPVAAPAPAEKDSPLMGNYEALLERCSGFTPLHSLAVI